MEKEESAGSLVWKSAGCGVERELKVGTVIVYVVGLFGAST